MTSEGQKPVLFDNVRSVTDKRLIVAPNGRYLTDQHGEPFFYLGDTAWTLFKRLTLDEADLYFRNRAAKGFTVIQAYVLRGLDVTNLNGDTPLVDRDPTKLDEGFFQNIDALVNLANERGLTMGLVTTMGQHVRESHSERFLAHGKHEQIFTPDNAYEYGRLLGERYKNNCVIWLLGGDRNPFDDIAIWEGMAKGLKTGSDGVHLVSYHSSGGHSSSEWLHDRDWLDFNAIQSHHSWADPNYQLVTVDYGLVPVKPTMDIEARYEAHPSWGGAYPGRQMDGHQTREAAYWAVLAGAAGHGYGCNDIWQMADETKLDSTLDYSFPLLPPTSNWRTAMDYEGAFGIGYLRRLLEARPWYDMVPDQTIIASGQGEGEDHIQAARAGDGRFAVAYTPFGNPFGVHMEKLSGNAVKVQWYDPRQGTWESIGEFSNRGEQVFTPPSTGDQNDWVLVLDSVE